MKEAVVRTVSLSVVALLSARCGVHKEAEPTESAASELSGCENVAASVASDGTINQVVSAPAAAPTCRRTSVVDLTNARPQTLRVQLAGSPPTDAGACQGAALRADFYVQSDGQFALAQQGAFSTGQWVSGACQLPEVSFVIATAGTYRAAIRVAPWQAPVSITTTLNGDTPMMQPSAMPPLPTSAGAGPAGPYALGAPGSSTRDVQPTTERPAPSTQPGFFGTTCDYSHMAKDDPIVFPNLPGVAHLHTFFGNSLANAFSTYESLMTSGNSTCRGGIVNRTAYWVPTLLHHGVPVVPALSNFYYQGGFGIPDVGRVIQYIPDGLRMVAGSAKATAPQNIEHFHWSCLNTWEPIRHQSALTAVDCPDDDYIQMDVIFPQCWNAHDLDSPDHVSHMAYPVDGHCPATHPYVMPAIELHVAYARRGLDLTQLRLASDSYSTDQPGGYSVHADWFGAWEPAIKNAIVDGCLRPGVDCHSHLLGDGRAIF